MSAPLKMTPREVANLAKFMSALTEATRETGVRAGSYGAFDVEVGEKANLRLWWDPDERAYIVDDRCGD